MAHDDAGDPGRGSISVTSWVEGGGIPDGHDP